MTALIMWKTPSNGKERKRDIVTLWVTVSLARALLRVLGYGVFPQGFGTSPLGVMSLSVIFSEPQKRVRLGLKFYSATRLIRNVAGNVAYPRFNQDLGPSQCCFCFCLLRVAKTKSSCISR